ncbi:hypothetical protein MTR_1352s0010 [Medicago truncatula]|uniref:Uncharacterized protein n=1 Tax=Medicago truncatula TaxID=3880 RepID=G7ZVX3_MEDTR|nr:hypothetical protein MTR_1352s0010 [Medicago truncatula]
MEKIRIKGRKPKSSVEEGCKHIENGFPKIKEGTKANVMSIKKTLVINKVSINNNDDEASVVDKEKGNMIQTNEQLESSFSLKGEVLAFESHFLPFAYDALQFGEGATKFFEDGTDSRLELNIVEASPIFSSTLESVPSSKNFEAPNPICSASCGKSRKCDANSRISSSKEDEVLTPHLFESYSFFHYQQR